MLCMLCKRKEAKVHLCQIIGDETKKFDLWEDCAEARRVDDPADSCLLDLLDAVRSRKAQRRARAVSAVPPPTEFCHRKSRLAKNEGEGSTIH
ncbi:MAG: hypothetical protein HYY24_18410 [Verrucomicrobia bacterium]|nr:hypothetical protein [Verrucomicrobiota bacterium]